MRAGQGLVPRLRPGRRGSSPQEVFVTQVILPEIDMIGKSCPPHSRTTRELVEIPEQEMREDIDAAVPNCTKRTRCPRRWSSRPGERGARHLHVELRNRLALSLRGRESHPRITGHSIRSRSRYGIVGERSMDARRRMIAKGSGRYGRQPEVGNLMRSCCPTRARSAAAVSGTTSRA